MLLVTLGLVSIIAPKLAAGFLSFKCADPYGEMDLDVRSVLDMQLHNDMVMDNRWLVDPGTPRWMPVLFQGNLRSPGKRVLFGVGEFLEESGSVIQHYAADYSSRPEASCKSSCRFSLSSTSKLPKARVRTVHKEGGLQLQFESEKGELLLTCPSANPENNEL
ncbi:cysM [Symbiodinium natans]|uniref:CysM protein n=1 Tax=Symbiodinium natans TaxID=878477 RepID=A0A812J9Y8_9DINO|nr:cysM [Symbiodinium natans]